jgi:hypothetical protein
MATCQGAQRLKGNWLLRYQRKFKRAVLGGVP